jgi:hypothetical protein
LSRVWSAVWRGRDTSPLIAAVMIVGVTVASVSFNSTVATAQVRYLNSQIDPERKNQMRIRDIANRECITIKGQIRQEKISTAVVSHHLMAENGCPKVIRIKACYVDSTRCVEFDMGSREKKDILLGVTTANATDPFFKFNFTEKALF